MPIVRSLTVAHTAPEYVAYTGRIFRRCVCHCQCRHHWQAYPLTVCADSALDRHAFTVSTGELPFLTFGLCGLESWPRRGPQLCVKETQSRRRGQHARLLQRTLSLLTNAYTQLLVSQVPSWTGAPRVRQSTAPRTVSRGSHLELCERGVGLREPQQLQGL